MKQRINKLCSLLLVFAMVMTFIPVSATTITDGTNGDTIYLSLKFTDEAGVNTITKVSAGEKFRIYVNFAGNPTVLADSIQAYDLLIGYNPDKISFPGGNEEGYFAELTTPTFAFSFADGVCYAGWSSLSGISVQDDKMTKIQEEGSLFGLNVQALADLTIEDLNAITFLESATGSALSQITQMTDGSRKQFKLVQVPEFAVSDVPDEVDADDAAEDIKAKIPSFTFIDASGASTIYTSANTVEWNRLEVLLPDDGLVIGENTLTARFDGATSTFKVTVKDRISGITIATPPMKTDYVAFETFDPTGMVVTATYASGATADVTAQCVVDTTTQLKVADTKWTITYDAFTTQQDITVAKFGVEKPVASTVAVIYNGQTQTFDYATAPNASYVTVTGDTSGKNVGTYNATVSLKDKANTKWEDDTDANLTLSWTIRKASVISGMSDFSAKYSAKYSKLLSDGKANLTGVDGETVRASITWYTDDTYETVADSNATIAGPEDVTGSVTLYYKATGMANYEDYEGSVSVLIKGKDAGTISVKNLPTGLTENSGTITGTYKEAGYTLSASDFAAKKASGASLGDAKTLTITKDSVIVDRITDAGTYIVTATYEDDDNIASAEFAVEISPKSIEGLEVTLSREEFDYTGSSFAPEVISVEGLTDADYEVTVNDPKTDVSDTLYEVIITGKGNYTDTTKGYWKITPKVIAFESAVIADKYYDGGVDNVNVTAFTFSDGVVLNKGVDFEIVSATYADKNAADDVAVTVTIALKDTVKNYKFARETATVVSSGKINKIAASDIYAADEEQTLYSSAVLGTALREYTFNLGSIITNIPDDYGTITYTVKEEGTYVKKQGEGIEGSLLKVKVTPQHADVTDTVVVTVSTVNYEDQDVEIDFIFKDKNLIDDITLENVTVEYGETYNPENAVSEWVTNNGDPANWTYTYSNFTPTPENPYPYKVGEYEVTATYEDDVVENGIAGHRGTAGATITILPKELTITDGNLAITKKYDGTNAVASWTGCLGLDGVLADDEVSIVLSNLNVGDFDSEEAGTRTVTITGIVLSGADKDNYVLNETTYEFVNAVITQKEQIPVTIRGVENVTFGDAPLTIVVGGGNGTGDYTLEASDSDAIRLETDDNITWTATILKAGSFTVTASRESDNNYEAAADVQATILVTPKNIAKSDFTAIDVADKVFTGEAIEPSVESALTENVDYEVSYTSNENVGTATITITGIGNYTSYFVETFEIVEKELNDVEFTVSGFNASYEYKGEAFTPEVIVEMGNITLVKETDYNVAFANNTNAGTATITITGIGNYNGTLAKTFVIEPKALTITDGTLVIEKSYDGNTDVTSWSGNLAINGILGDDVVRLTIGAGNIGSYDSAELGTHTVVISGLTLEGADKDNYTISATYNFTNAKIITRGQAPVTVSGVQNGGILNYGDVVTVLLGGGSGTGAYTLTSSDTSVLGLATDDSTTWQVNALKVGTVTLTASRLGDHAFVPAENVEITLTVIPKHIAAGDFTIDLESKAYTGEEIKPSVTSETLVVGRDYEVAYSNNVNVASNAATITITGKGNYTATVSKTFAIVPKALNETEFTVSGYEESYGFTSFAIEPEVTVNWGDVLLVKDTDYSVAFADNTNVGTATITITGIGNYSESVAATFEIMPAAFEGSISIDSNTASITTGTVLTANTTLATGDVLTYQWKRNGEDIADATANTYTVTEDDATQEISVVVTSSGNYEGTLESLAVTVGKTAMRGTVTIAEADGVVTVTVADAPDAENYDIKWLRNGVEIEGATSETYTLVYNDKGTTLTARLVAKEDSVFTGEILSNAILVPAEAPSFTKNPELVSGDQKLTVSYDVLANGSAILGYKIKVNGTVVSGETLITETSYEITGLNNEVQYTISVIAVNAVGETESNEVSGKPFRPAVVGGGGAGGAIPNFAINSASKVEGGKYTTNVTSAKPGTKIVITTTPDEGYELSKITVLDKDNKVVPVTKDGNEYTLTMPKSKITIKAEFVLIGENVDDTPISSFNDVKKFDYYFNAVEWALKNNITSGTAANTFSPNEECTRAQMITFLWRAAGAPKATAGANAFTDIEAGSYYYDAVMWAVENGITSGVSATEFDPHAIVSRAQSVTFLWRIANNPEVSANNAFDDVHDSAYYNDAVTWAANAEVTNGISATSFGPDFACTRAQIVTFIYRYFVK